VSTLRDLTNGTFQLVIDDVDALEPQKVKRVLFCSGKVYYTLLQARAQRVIDNVALARVEQFYPFPARQISAVLAHYPEARDVRWVQEEPANMGGWSFTRSRLQALLGPEQTLSYAGPEEAASPATGNYQLHAREEAEFVDRALERVDRPLRAVRAVPEKAEAVGGRRER